MDYMGVDMNFQMIRGKRLEEVIAAFESVGPDEEPDDAISGACNIGFLPKGRPRNSTHRRNASTLQRGDFSFRNDASRYGDTYWLVVRSLRKWAPVEIETQDYSVAVVLSADDPQLYNSVSVRLQQRTRVRTRA